MAYLLGVDLGTSSVKAIIMREDGKIMAIGQQEYGIEMPKPGYSQQNPCIWWDAQVTAVRIALKKAPEAQGEIRAIGLSGQMHGLVVVDKAFLPVREAIIWCDQRSVAQVERLLQHMAHTDAAQRLLNRPAVGFLISSLLWMKENEPENYARIHSVLLPKDYLRLRMTGRISTDPSDASATLAYDIKEGKWYEALIGQLGLCHDIFPEILPSFSVAGTLIWEAAEAMGLPAGIPVAVGGGDQPVQALGNGIIHQGEASVTIGTGGQLFTPVDKPIYDPVMRTHTFSHVLPEQWYVMGAMLNAGQSLDWFTRKIVGGASSAMWDEDSKDISPGRDNPIFLPYLTGDRTPHMDPFAKGMFFGLTLRHEKKHLARAVMEGVAFSLKDCMEIVQSLGIPIKRILASGGGSNSPLWMQIVADVLGCELETSSCEEQAGRGAAMLAGIAIGLYKSAQDACDRVLGQVGSFIKPIAQNQLCYKPLYQLYREIYESNAHLFKEMSLIKQ